MVRNLFLLFFVFGGCTGLLSGQTATSSLAGTVRDSTGGVLPGVNLTITNQATGQQRHVVTDSNGSYFATSLPIGEYTIKAELPGFKTEVRQGIVLQLGRQGNADLFMEVGNVSEEVTVEEAAAPLQTASAELSEVIDNTR